MAPVRKFLAVLLLAVFSATTAFAAAPLSPEQMQAILAIPKGERPAPSTYLSSKYIRKHLKQFRKGLSIVMGLDSFERYVLRAEKIGRDDNTCFVMPKTFCDAIEKEAAGDLTIWERKLSFDEGYFASQGGLVRVDIPDFDWLNLRIPDGNEAGANDYWIPGGWTLGDTPEAVVDKIPKTRITVRFL